MKNFEYVIKDELGIHARPAAVLVKEVKKFESKVVLRCGDKECEIVKLFALMSLAIKKGDTVNVSIEGADENVAYENIKRFFEENL